MIVPTFTRPRVDSPTGHTPLRDARRRLLEVAGLPEIERLLTDVGTEGHPSAACKLLARVRLDTHLDRYNGALDTVRLGAVHTLAATVISPSAALLKTGALMAPLGLSGAARGKPRGRGVATGQTAAVGSDPLVTIFNTGPVGNVGRRPTAAPPQGPAQAHSATAPSGRATRHAADGAHKNRMGTMYGYYQCAVCVARPGGRSSSAAAAAASVGSARVGAPDTLTDRRGTDAAHTRGGGAGGDGAEAAGAPPPTKRARH